MQQQRLKQLAMMQPSMYHPGLIAATQIEPILSGNLPPGFDSSTCRSVYVGNIHPQVTEPLLLESSYGFVDFFDRRCAAAAIITLNGRHLFGQPIKVNWAYVSTQREDTSGHYNIFVGDLSPEIMDSTLFTCFSVYSSCSDASVMWDQKTGRSRGFGFVSFRNHQVVTDDVLLFTEAFVLVIHCVFIIYVFNLFFTGCSECLLIWLLLCICLCCICILHPLFFHLFFFSGCLLSAQLCMYCLSFYYCAWKLLGNRRIRCNWAAKGANNSDDNQNSDSKNIGEITTGASDDGHERSTDDSPENNPLYRTVYVGNLAPEVSFVELHLHFHSLGAGAIEDVRVQRDKGFGFVRYSTHAEAALAIQLGHSRILCGKPIKCSWGNKQTPLGVNSNPLPPPATALFPGFTVAELAAHQRQMALMLLPSLRLASSRQQPLEWVKLVPAEPSTTGDSQALQPISSSCITIKPSWLLTSPMKPHGLFFSFFFFFLFSPFVSARCPREMRPEKQATMKSCVRSSGRAR
ncbi:hypothetical protein SAY87_026042 [Trapa incisa]|uniref:RRM domain-containing protein n=1 Tax=Trapa incisa TaxID=236973 RepID=A0AAN7GIV0_9MYRT|nr:hypothetical protein SAY87_026042 [Trapa incisa]